MNLFKALFMAFADVETIYSKKYEKDFKREDFDKIIRLDPLFKRNPSTVSGYGQWLLILAKKGLLKPEDYSKAEEVLALFEANKADIKARSAQDPSISVDIFKYKTLPDVSKVVYPYEGAGKPKDDATIRTNAELLANNYFLRTGQAEVIFQDSDLVLVVTKTLEANKYYGQDTKWCTQFPENWGNYSKEGPIYILIPRDGDFGEPDSRFQIQIESLQAMDIFDRPVVDGLNGIFSVYPQVKPIFEPKLWAKSDEETLSGNNKHFKEYIRKEGENFVWVINRIRENLKHLVDFRHHYRTNAQYYIDIITATDAGSLDYNFEPPEMRLSDYVSEVASNLTEENKKFIKDELAAVPEMQREFEEEFDGSSMEDWLLFALQRKASNFEMSNLVGGIEASLSGAAKDTSWQTIRTSAIKEIANHFQVQIRTSEHWNDVWEVLVTPQHLKEMVLKWYAGFNDNYPWEEIPIEILVYAHGRPDLDLERYHEMVGYYEINWEFFNDQLQSYIGERP